MFGTKCFIWRWN